MADFIDSEAEESEDELELSEKERKKLKKIKSTAEDSDEEEEDDEDVLREELRDLIDDNPIEEDDESGSESGDDAPRVKRKRDEDDEDELDDRLEEDDFDLLEENLGIKVKRKKQFVRVKRIEDDESEDEGHEGGRDRDAIATELFEGSDAEDERRERRDKDRSRSDAGDEEAEPDKYSEGEEEDEEDIGDFIVDADGRPIHEKRKKRKAIYTDAALQEAQDIFGVDFDYEDMQQEEEYDDEEDEVEEYEDEEGRKTRKVTSVRKVAKKRTQKKTIYEIYEPSELERGHFTDYDEQVRKKDMPERMQLRHVALAPCKEDSTELTLEAEWIYKHAFVKPTISNQQGSEGREKTRKGPQTVEKIRKALEFMRVHHFEVPFIAFYRKEYVQPDLSVTDLWRVYHFDEKWTQLQTRKANMMRLFEKMQKYQAEKLTQNVEQSIPEGVRLMKDEDMDRLRCVQSLEELNDVYAQFVLYYGADVPDMQEAHRKKERQEARERRAQDARLRQQRQESGEGGQAGEDGAALEGLDEAAAALMLEDDEAEREGPETVKQARRSDLYSLCSRAGLHGLVRKYGLTPEQFAENLRDNYQRHEVEQYPSEPSEVALEFVSAKFASSAEVLSAANYMLAVQIAREPVVRQCVREAFYERARIDVVPTKQGLKEIDENHPLFPFRFLKDKPVRELAGDQFLRLVTGEQDKLVTLRFDTDIKGATSPSYAEEVKQLFHRDEFSRTVQEWNDFRAKVVDVALNKIIFPVLVKELRAKLVNEAREAVLEACSYQLWNWLKTAPYRIEFPDEEEDEWDTKNGVRVMAISTVPDDEQASFGCLLSTDGECTDHLRLEHCTKRNTSRKESDRKGKERDMELIRNFILNKKPHVIAIGGESRQSLQLQEDLRVLVGGLIEQEHFPPINVELVDNMLPKVYSNSLRGESDFREYPPLLREAISTGRLLQDPLIEFAQLCNSDDEILCLKYHALQDELSKEELLHALQLEFVNRTNEVGVDINRAINYPHTSNLVQFVCGLGPRKSQALMKILKQSNQRLENRTQLVTACHMGPKVFINCAGFIKIDTNSLGDSTESYVEVLDGSRVHPETYEWARKMAVDALEYDDEDANPAGAVEEILEAPERLKDLDLDAFADELERQGFGNKSITLYDIRAELNHRYKDLRVPYEPPSAEEIFNMVTKESPKTFNIGKLVMATVTGFSHRKPQREQLDLANPVRNEETGLWKCPFCSQDDFPDLSEVWNHFDAGACMGQATGVRLRLENGLSGFIPIKCLSDREVSNPEERVRFGQTIHCRVTKIDIQRFSVTCTSKSSDLMDKNGLWKPTKDDYYDQAEEDRILKAEEDSKKLKQRQSYTKRVIVHPSFKNIGFKEAEKLMVTMDQGEVIVRPSSKGSDHLTVTWKVSDDIYQHVDVREEGKENAFSLGQSLWIGDEEFEDLDEIVARYINPMAAHARDIISFRYMKDLGLSGEQPLAPGRERERADELIKEDKKKNPSKIHYFVSASREFPGKFMLSYLPRGHVKHEFITVTPDGYRFRGQVFDNLNTLFRWFKEHFRDPIPGTPLSSRTGHAAAAGGTSSRTPGAYGPTGTTPNVNLAAVNPETLHRVAQSMPSHMLASLSQAAHFQGTPGPFGYPANTPYTPSGQTPFMTPYATTPHQPQTPRYSGTTPAPAPTPGSSYPPAQAGQMTPQSAMFRTPATPSASRGYGGQGMAPPSPYSGRSGGPSSSSSSASYAPPRPHSQAGTPGSSSASHSRAQSSEPTDWKRAAEAWAQSRPKPNQQRGAGADGGHSTTPRSSGSASQRASFDEQRRTPRSSEGSGSRSAEPPGRQTPKPVGAAAGHPSRAGSATPRDRDRRRDASPGLGDATPLYDE